MQPEITYAYLGNITKSRDDKGFLHVKGLATDDTLDLDDQICDAEWLSGAMSQWFKTGNIREMHQLSAVGKATSMTQRGTGWEVNAKIVDKSAAEKADNEVYTGFSIGIKGARVDESKEALKRAPKGVIVGGRIVEVSLVDLPANPSAVLELVKTVGDVTVKTDSLGEVDEDIEKADAFKPAPYKKDPDETVQCPKCERMNDTDAHYCDQCGYKLDGSTDVEVKTAEVDIVKAVEPEEIKAVEGETETPPATTNDGDEMAYIGLGISPDLVKRAGSAEATEDDKTELKTELRKSLGIDEIATKAELDDLREANKSLKAALDDIREMAAPGQPALRAMFDQQNKSAEADELDLTAQKYRSTAYSSTDKATMAQYLEAADALTKRAQSMRQPN